MELVGIRVQKFKGIRDAEIALTNATVLVGTNNCGKSSFLQAVHFASRAIAHAKDANKQTTLSLSELDYIPSQSYREIYHGGTWGNFAGANESKITFTFRSPEFENDVSARVILKSARNEGISINPSLPYAVISDFRTRAELFSAYIPGISGIPVEESFLSSRHVLRKAASGDSNVVLRNILYRISRAKKQHELMSALRGVYPNAEVNVSFADQKDFYVQCMANTRGGFVMKPLEFAGTGFIHTLQVLSYLVFFKPKVLLIDEPESHLHPTLQTRLTRTLEYEARKRGCKVLITTHSPFVMRGLPLHSSSIWLKNGETEASSQKDEIKKALGWGVLDKNVVICTEDGKTGFLQELIAQHSSIDSQVCVFPFEGVDKLGTVSQLDNFRKALGGSHRFIVHRDRDCMSDAELSKWRKEYEDRNIATIVTKGSDIEMYCCEPGHISAALSVPFNTASEILELALEELEQDAKTDFENKRSQINKRLYEKVGGSPSTEDLWNTLPYTERYKGKSLVKRVRKVANDLGYDEKSIGKCSESYVTGLDLIKQISLIQK